MSFFSLNKITFINEIVNGYSIKLNKAQIGEGPQNLNP